MRYEPSRASSRDVERLRNEILDLLGISERLSRDMDDLFRQTRAFEGEHRALFERLRRAHDQRLALERDLRTFRDRIQRARR